MATATHLQQPRRVAIFFYGLFMDADILRQHGLEPGLSRQAKIQGMTLRIGDRATLVPSADGITHGMLMELTHDDIHRLYAGESVAMYRPEPVLARIADGSTISALCFNLPEAPSSHQANKEYARKLVDVGRKVGLPSDYVAGLARYDPSS